MKKSSAVRPRTFGLSLLIVVFLILCLLTFAAISVTESHADLARAQTSFETVRSYEEACNFAETALRDATREAAADPDSAAEVLSFSVSVNEHDDLWTEAELRLDEATGLPYYEITSFVLKASTDTEVDDRENLMTDGQIGW